MSKPVTRTRTPNQRTVERLGLAALHTTAFIGGAAVMVLEIIGTRVIGPIFGVTLFVWAALLSVTLGSLALGYYIGGIAIDRRPERALLAAILGAAGALIVLSAVVSAAVLKLTISFGPRLGPMASATLLFAPALVALGMVAPAAIRLSASETSITGHRAGSISALSTAGSLAATCATAFLFIPSFATPHILQATAAILMLTGAFVSVRRRVPLTAAAIVVPLLPSAISHRAAPSGVTVLDQAQSAYGLVQVIDDAERHVRLLRSDHSIIGAAYTDNSHANPFEYLDVLESVRCMRPGAKRMLQLGLGTGTLASAIRAHGSNVDIVEIDPNVVRFAGRYFEFENAGQVVVEDARTWLRTAPDHQYDVVIHDTFTGGATPEHLLSAEALTSVRDVLRPGGMLALNFVGYTEGDAAAATWALARTVASVFKNYRMYRDDASELELANVIIFASDAALPWVDAQAADCQQLAAAANKWKVVDHVPAGVLLRDASNPIAQLHMPAASEHFLLMNQLLSADVWLNTDLAR